MPCAAPISMSNKIRDRVRDLITPRPRHFTIGPEKRQLAFLPTGSEPPMSKVNSTYNNAPECGESPAGVEKSY